MFWTRDVEEVLILTTQLSNHVLFHLVFTIVTKVHAEQLARVINGDGAKNGLEDEFSALVVARDKDGNGRVVAMLGKNFIPTAVSKMSGNQFVRETFEVDRIAVGDIPKLEKAKKNGKHAENLQDVEEDLVAYKCGMQSEGADGKHASKDEIRYSGAKVQGKEEMH